jgi:hypothetical protein
MLHEAFIHFNLHEMEKKEKKHGVQNFHSFQSTQFFIHLDLPSTIGNVSYSK